MNTASTTSDGAERSMVPTPRSRRTAINPAPSTAPDQPATADISRPPVFLPRAEVERRVGLRRSAIYRRMKEGKFPTAIHDMESATVWWLESEVEAWQTARIDARGMGTSMGRNE